jgi:50S ribosomal protein L16 3-hydroxylase
MTYSVGFRAPSRGDLIDGWSAHLVDAAAEDDRYTDPDLVEQAHPGEITAAALSRLHAMATAAMADSAAFARWFGAYSSLTKYADADWRPEQPTSAQEVQASLKTGLSLLRNPASRFAFVRQEDAAVLLFADGQCFDCAGDAAVLAENLCAQAEMAPPLQWAQSMPVVRLIAALINQGSVTFEDAD